MATGAALSAGFFTRFKIREVPDAWTTGSAATGSGAGFSFGLSPFFGVYTPVSQRKRGVAVRPYLDLIAIGVESVRFAHSLHVTSGRRVSGITCTEALALARRSILPKWKI